MGGRNALCMTPLGSPHGSGEAGMRSILDLVHPRVGISGGTFNYLTRIRRIKPCTLTTTPTSGETSPLSGSIPTMTTNYQLRAFICIRMVSLLST